MKSAAKGSIKAGAFGLRPGWYQGPAGTEGGKPQPDDGLLNLALWPLNVVNAR
jgi:hypothetical protein